VSKIAIIGAGISGLSIAQMLKDKNEVIIFEASDRPGGLIKCDRINGNLFHRTGGHVFNTKRTDVLDWFWNFFDKNYEFTKTNRNAVVSMPDKNLIPYPIENHVYLLDENIVLSIIQDLIKLIREGKKEPQNFEEFLRYRFGETLYEIYFKPYNEKIWRNNLANIPLTWLEGKLPMPTVEEILLSNIKRVEEKSFVHSSFFYPQQDGSQFIADRLAKGLNIKYNTRVNSVKRVESKWLVNGLEVDKVIFCGNIKQIPKLLSNQIDISAFIKPIEGLESHGTSAVFCEIEQNPYSWVYMPSKEYQSHRIICTGNFSKSNNAAEKMTATVEFTDGITLEEVKENLKKIPFSPKYLAHHYEKYTYPIQNKSTKEMIGKFKEKLATENFYLLGRFAEWEYYNMDAAMGTAMDLQRNLFD
jgi:protoporphyrinogen oxidase